MEFQIGERTTTNHFNGFVYDTTNLCENEYKASVKRELRTLRKIGILFYEPISNLSPKYRFYLPKEKYTPEDLMNSFLDNVQKLQTPEKINSITYQVKQMINGKTV